mmetsp:Transcript_13668/g.32626  ORF Transcript_13668/g.32626 Transcript_13668/m.32626 type:complete len:426 (+) Transcript_13668:48-1325(+)
MAGKESEIQELSAALQPEVDAEELHLVTEERTPVREASLGSPGFSTRWARRVAGVAALGLMVFAVAPKMGLPGAKSAEFLEGVGSNAWHSLEAELDSSKELPTVGLAHISPASGKVLCMVDVAQAVARVMLTGAFTQFSTKVCDFDRITRTQRRPVKNDERERCASGIFGILLSVELGMGVIASSVSTCSGMLNVPANCAANIGAFTGGLSVMMQSTLSADLICAKGVTAGARGPEEKTNAYINSRKNAFNRQKAIAREAAHKYLINAGVKGVKALPVSRVRSELVYGAVNRCVAQIDLGATFVMRFAIILADSTLGCSEGNIAAGKGRVCAVQMTGLMAVLSLTIRFFSLASASCVAIVGKGNRDANCVAACTGITGSTFAMTSSGMNLDAACRKAFGDWDPRKWPTGKIEVPGMDGNVDIAEP